MTILRERIVAQRLLPYQHLYTSSPMSKLILREYLGLPLEQVIPLSISHGIDFNHERFAQDVTNVEPIHWSYNNDILRRSISLKKSIVLPHPWLMLHSLMHRPEAKENGKVLVIGPPPSRYNDEYLFKSLSSNGIKPDAILLKSRGDRQVERSYKFWESQMVTPVTAGGRDPLHYHRLMSLLLEYEFVVSPFLSSVTVMASAVKCKILVLSDYHYCSYGIGELDFLSVYNSPTVRDLICAYKDNGSRLDVMEMSERLLGSEYVEKVDACRERFFNEVESVDHPLYVAAAKGGKLHSHALAVIARYSGRSAFLKYGLLKGIQYKLRGTQEAVVCKKVNMIDAAVNGLSEENFRVRPLKNSEHGAVPGQGAEW